MTPTKSSSRGCILSKCGRHAIWLTCLPILLVLNSSARAERETLSLDGTWEIEDGKSPNEIPATFRHTVPVPGLSNLATPPLENVDRFLSRAFSDPRQVCRMLPTKAHLSVVGR